MPTVALRVTFVTEEDARKEVNGFPAQELPYVRRVERKRDGATWVVLADLLERRDLDTLRTLFRMHRFVTDVNEITEAEWARAPSNSI